MRAVDVAFPSTCPGCGTPGRAVCHACERTLVRGPRPHIPPGLDAVFAAFAYEGVARELIARVKYRNERAVVPWLVSAMVAELAAPPLFDTVIWVPTTGERRRRRGFDHAQLLAAGVADRIGLRAQGPLRRVGGVAQTGATRAVRIEGPSFSCTTRQDGLRVLVVDDVLTTGATLRSAAGALKANGARSVVGLVAGWRRPESATARRRVSA
jgi:ComF family protein